MAKGYLGIRLPPWYGDPHDLLLRMVFAIHGYGCEIWVKGKPESNYFTNFVMYTYILFDAKKVKVAMGVNCGRHREDDTPRLFLRTRRKYLHQARAFVLAVLAEISGESLEYKVDVASNMVKWKMGDRNGCVSDVFEVVRTVGSDRAVQWHVFDYQNRGTGTVLRPGIFYI